MSRRARARAALLGPVFVLGLVALGACVDPDPYHGPGEGGSTPPPPIADLAIDSGGELTLSPGAGVGVAVEYAGDGRWSVATSCDTPLTGLRCTYDLVVSTDELAPITDSDGDALGDGDTLLAPNRFALEAELQTSDELDEFGFTTSPGATVRVSALLYDPSDGWGWSEDPRILSWVGNGAVHHGAPSNPVDLTPDRP